MASRADNIASNLSLANFSKATELKNRIWFTVGALVVFRFLSFVPLPGVNPLVLESLYSQTKGGILDLFNTFSGGSLQRMSLIALGVMPYITASIVIQLAASLHPSLMALKKEGEAGRKKLNQYTRYGTVLLCAIQGWFLAAGLEAYASAVLQQGDRIVVLQHRLPAEARQPVEHGADAVRPLVRHRLERLLDETELLVLGADAPVGARLFAGGDVLDQLAFVADDLAAG